MARPWHIELARSAAGALRALPRDQKRAVVRRIDDLRDHGMPPSVQEDAERVGVGVVHAADQRIVVAVDTDRHRILVVAVVSETSSVRPALGRLARSTIPRWIKDTLGGDGMGAIKRDLKFAFRSLSRSPGFALTAILTLAMGIGASAAIFSVANGVLLRPLPYGEPEEVVTIWSSWTNFPDKTWVSESEFQYYYQENRTLEDVGMYATFNVNFTSPENPERVAAAGTTPNLFSVLGVEPVIGRAYTWEEARDQTPVLMLAYAPWQRRFGGSPDVIGREIEVNGNATTVVGVLPQGFVLPVDFASPSASEVFYPLFVDVETPAQVPLGGGSHGRYLAARLGEGETAASALADLEGLIGRLEAEGIYPAELEFHPRVFPVKADVVGSARGTLMVLLAAVGFVLLIACGNVANLLLARSQVRAHEVAVRRALGAGRGRVLRQFLTESLLMAGLAGALGLLFAYVGVDALLAIDPEAVPRSADVGLDGTVVGFTILVSGLTAVLFGTAPALRVIRSGGSPGHDGARGAGRTTSQRTQGLLVASQMAMAVVLLTGSGLMIRTFLSLLQVDPGFRAENVLTMRVTAPGGTYAGPEEVVAFYDELLRQVRTMPGVTGAGAARLLPLASQMGDAGFRPVAYAPAPNEFTQADWQWATPGYLETMGIPLIEGRVFDDRDVPDGQLVVVINETLAHRYWRGESPLGSSVLAMGGDTAVVVGVVGDVSHNGITGPVKGRFYRPQAQVSRALGTIRSMTLTIQTEGRPEQHIEPVRRAIRELDPSMPVSEIRTVDQVLSASVAQPRFSMVLLATFAGLAVTLAIVGIYGVLSYAVSQRTREIGVRMALGAETGQVVTLVVRQGMLMALVGAAVGTAVAYGLTRFMAGMLYGVSAQDPITFVLVPSLFAMVALAASLLPAARAARVDPSAALRWE